MIATAPLFTIVVDTREQQPLDFGAWPTVRATLESGDYSIEGYADRVALERKSLPDLFACTGRERERFERELARLAEFDYAGLIIEGSLRDVLAGIERSLVSPRSVAGSLAAWSIDFGLPVWLCDDRRHAAAMVRKLLAKWFKRNVAEPAGLRGRSKL